jgi:hypothetical protein
MSGLSEPLPVSRCQCRTPAAAGILASGERGQRLVTLLPLHGLPQDATVGLHARSFCIFGVHAADEFCYR